MSRKQRPAEPLTPRQVERASTAPADPASSDIPRERRCPCCFNGRGGVGQQYDSAGCSGTVTGLRRYWRCNQCGHTWSSDHQMAVVRINHRLPPAIETRGLAGASCAASVSE